MRVAVGHLRIGLTCGRLDVIEIFTTGRFDEFAVNEISDANRGLGHNKLRGQISGDSFQPSHKATARQATSLEMTRSGTGPTNRLTMNWLISTDSARMCAGDATQIYL